MTTLYDIFFNYIMVLVELLYPYLLPVVLCLFAISLWQYYINSLRDRHSDLPLPPGTVGLPFIGETLHMIFQGWSFYKVRKARYGRIYKTHILGKPTIRVWGTANIRKVLKNEETLVTMAWPTSVMELMGRGGLVASTRRTHNLRRAAMSKPLSSKTISEFGSEIEKLMVNRMQNWCSQSNAVPGVLECRKMVLQVASYVLLGTTFTPAQVDRLMENMGTIADNFFTLAIDVPGTGFNKAMKARRESIAMIRDVIQRIYKKEEDPENAPNEHSLLAMVMEQVVAGELNQYELEDTIIEMFFSSYQGLASLTCSTIVHLGRNPDVVDKLRKELNGYTVESLSQLPYLEKCWKEVARIAPPFGGGFRQVLKTFELEGYQIPAGWTVLYSIRDNQEAEENYPKADVFNPDRWDGVTTDESFLVFGGNGIRSCIGKSLTVQIIRQFIAALVSETEWRLLNENPEFTSMPTYLPKDGLPLEFQPRKAAHSY